MTGGTRFVLEYVLLVCPGFVFEFTECGLDFRFSPTCQWEQYTQVSIRVEWWSGCHKLVDRMDVLWEEHSTHSTVQRFYSIGRLRAIIGSRFVIVATITRLS